VRYSKIRESELRKKLRKGDKYLFDEKPENEDETTIIH
jgi:hypothetical protein